MKIEKLSFKRACAVMLIFFMSIISNPLAAKRSGPDKVVASQSEIKSFLGGQSGILIWKADSPMPRSMNYVDFSDPSLKVKSAFQWSGGKGDYQRPSLTVDGTRAIFAQPSASVVWMVRLSDKKKNKIVSGVSTAGTHVQKEGKEYLYYVRDRKLRRMPIKKGDVIADGPEEVVHEHSKGSRLTSDARWQMYNFGGSSGPPLTYDMNNNKEYSVPYNAQRCQGSFAYGTNPYRLAHMILPHVKYHIYEWSEGTKKWSRTKSISKPSKYREVNWGTFSVNHPDYMWTSGHLSDKRGDLLLVNVKSSKFLNVVELGGSYDRPRGGALWVGSGAAQLTLDKGELNFTAKQGANNPEALNITVNTTKGSLQNLKASESANWLSVSVSGNKVKNSVNINGLTKGEYSENVKVTANGFPSVQYSVKLKITNDVSVHSLEISPNAVNVMLEESLKFKLTAKDDKGQSIDVPEGVSWTVSEGGSISDEGVLTAGKKEGGPYEVKALLKKDDKNLSATAQVTLIQAIKIFKFNAQNKIKVGETVNIKWDAYEDEVNDIEIHLIKGSIRIPITLGSSVTEDDPTWENYPWTVPSKFGAHMLDGSGWQLELNLYGGGFNTKSEPITIEESSSITFGNKTLKGFGMNSGRSFSNGFYVDGKWYNYSGKRFKVKK